MFKLGLLLSSLSCLLTENAFAAVCHITEINKCGTDVLNDYSIPEEICKDYPYTSCTVPTYLYDQCPDDNTRYRACVKDTDRACTEAGYSLTCPDGYVADNTQTCPYDNIYTKCKCNPCEGYTYTEKEANAQGYVPDGSCLSCSETKYKRKENTCVGYYECECGETAGASACYSGATQKFNSCKSCETCASRFKYDSSNCTGNKVLAGSVCGNKYTKCVIPAKILYGDGTTSIDIIPGLTPIGVVINDGDGGYYGGRYIAMALTDVQKDGTPGSERMKWSTGICDTAQENCIVQTDLGDAWSTSCGDNGKINTQILLQETCGGTYEAAEAVAIYEPVGCVEDFCRRGNWFFPSDWELSYISGYGIQITLDKIRNSGYTVVNTSGKRYLCSTEGDENRTPTTYIDNDYYSPSSYSEKDEDPGEYVRPVIEF